MKKFILFTLVSCMFAVVIASKTSHIVDDGFPCDSTIVEVDSMYPYDDLVDSMYVVDDDDTCIVEENYDYNMDGVEDSQDFYYEVMMERVSYDDQVEEKFLQLMQLSPDYAPLFIEERKVWEDYMSKVKLVSLVEDQGTSQDVFISCLMSQGTELREISIENVLKFLKHEKLKHTSKTRFTSAMISAAYATFHKAIRGPLKGLEKNKIQVYDERIKAEKSAWEKWMAKRAEISSKLPADLRTIYDECTNMTMREKLLQIKNQYEDCGLCSDEVFEVALPYDCTDAELLAYPCFNKAWEKHCEQDE